MLRIPQRDGPPPPLRRGLTQAAFFCALLSGCAAEVPPGEEDLGPIEAVIDEVARTVWPGVEGESGRHLRLLNGFFEGSPSAYWFGGFASRRSSDVFWFCRENDAACPLSEQGVITADRAIGDPVFATVPGESSYSPFWQLWVVRVPGDYAANELKSVLGIEAATKQGRVSVQPVIFDHGGDVGPGRALVHCLLVLDGTELQGNGDPLPETGEPSWTVPLLSGWHKQYRLNFFEFSESDGVLPPDPASESRPVLPSANLFLLYRDCVGGSLSPSCDGDGDELGAVSERGVEADLTGDGDRRDNNNLLSGFQGITGTDPWARAYSPLWRVKQAMVPAEFDDEVTLIDSSGDQNVTDVRSLADLRALVELGQVREPVDLLEWDVGNPVVGNDGIVFFNCPSQRGW